MSKQTKITNIASSVLESLDEIKSIVENIQNYNKYSPRMDDFVNSRDVLEREMDLLETLVDKP